MKRLICLAMSFLVLASLNGCHNAGCGLALQAQIELGSTTTQTTDLLACCGDSRSLKLNLDSADIDSIDLANSAVTSGHVDAFLTDATCGSLFAQQYNGAGTAPAICHVYIGPVAAGTVSSRQQIPRGTYRLIVQAWDSNTDANRFDATVGVYSSDCRLTGNVGPTL